MNSAANETGHQKAAVTPKRNVKIAIVVLTLAALAVAVFTLPVKDWLTKGLEWTEGLGFWGPLVIVVVYIIATVCFVPGTILTLGAGFLFGIVKGTIAISIGSTLGAAAAFLVGRTVARGWVSRKIAGNEKFFAIDNAVGNEGFKIVLLTRLSPVFPFNVLNYLYSLTSVSFWRFFFASWIGMFPGTVMYVYFGAGMKSLTEVATGEVESNAAQRVFFWIGLAVTIAVTVFVTRLARKALKNAVAQPLDA